MILGLYSIYDKKGRIYEPPRYCINEDTAARQFQVIFENVKSMYNRFPTDYEVYYVGNFNDDTATFTHIGTPHFKWNGGELIKEREVEGQHMLFQTGKGHIPTLQKTEAKNEQKTHHA